jgi:hypothetical protein
VRGRELELPRGDDLEQVVGLLAGARSEDDLEAAREPVARELRADRVVLKTASDALTREVVQILAGDPSAAPAEVARLLADGYGSLLRVPSPARESSKARSSCTAQASSHGAGSRSAARA